MRAARARRRPRAQPSSSRPTCRARSRPSPTRCRSSRRTRSGSASSTAPPAASARTTSRWRGLRRDHHRVQRAARRAAAAELAEKEGVDIRLYRVIYEAVDDIRRRCRACSSPRSETVELGEAEVRRLFRVPRLGTIAGSYVRQRRRSVRNAKARARPRRHRRPRRHGRVAPAVQGRRARGRARASSAASGSRTSRTSRRATSSRPTRSRRVARSI